VRLSELIKFLHRVDFVYDRLAVSVEHSVRLVGNEQRTGRLEIFHNSTWGTVCDDGFTSASAKVACFSLGFG